MASDRKTQQLQMRVSPAQKRAIEERARKAGMSMSDWVLSRVLPSVQESFQGLLEELSRAQEPGYAFAELLEFLDALAPGEYRRAVSEPTRARLDPYWANYVAATVEHAAALKQVEPPRWTRDVPPLEEPVFGSSLQSLRLYLLTNSPPAFRRRNIFIDTSVGGRV